MIFHKELQSEHDHAIYFIGGSRGACRVHAPPPQGSRFFRFDIQSFRNVTALGVIAPLLRGPRLLWEILDPPLIFHWRIQGAET